MQMLRSKQEQISFMSSDFAIEHLIPEGDYYRLFREKVWPLFNDEEFAHIYTEKTGRPSKSPAVMTMALILQRQLNVSDREMENRARYDIRVKYALGIDLDDYGFDHSLLGKHRDRLRDNNLEKQAFERVLKTIIDAGLIQTEEIQRTDSTHMVADIAFVSTRKLITQGIREILFAWRNYNQKTFKDIAPDFQAYLEKRPKSVNEFKLSSEEKHSKLTQTVMDARRLVELVETQNFNPKTKVYKRTEVLKQILNENIDGDDPTEKDKEDKPKNRIISGSDPDARLGSKSNKKHFNGYKVHTTESVKNHFITNIEATAGNILDHEPTVEMIREQERTGLHPSKLIADKAYGTGSNIRELEKNETILVAPPKEKVSRTGLLKINEFLYDDIKQTVTCPSGEITNTKHYNKRYDTTVFSFSKATCHNFSLQSECTTNSTGRKIAISEYYFELKKAKEYSKTEQYKQDMKLRPMIEGKQSEMVRYHGLRRAIYRGLEKVTIQAYFTAAAVNLKRFFKLLQNPDLVSI